LAEFENEMMILVTELLNGRTDARRFRRLEKILHTHAEARRYYREILSMHTDLKTTLGKGTQLPDMVTQSDNTKLNTCKKTKNTAIITRLPASAGPE
jgi:hypothetical protein